MYNMTIKNKSCPPDNNHELINDVKIRELEKRVDMRSAAAQQAVNLAANDLRARLDAMNEFRAALKDQSFTFVPRNEMDAKLESFSKELKQVEITHAMIEGKASQTGVNFSLIIAVGSFLSSIILHFIK